MNSLDVLNPLDGRYRELIAPLAKFFSESALIRYRVALEAAYFVALSQNPKTGLRRFSKKEKRVVEKLFRLAASDVQKIKEIETGSKTNFKGTRHDVKAVEYFIKERLAKTSLKNCVEWVHFALTSEDINSVSYGLAIRGALEKVIIPTLENLINKIEVFSRKYRNLPMLARTHGQPASPTTLGKEFAIFAARLIHQVAILKKHVVFVKFGGATGNFNAHYAACPQVSWPIFTEKFVTSFNADEKIRLALNPLTTQIEPGDTLAELSDIMRRINTILVGFAQDIWRYMSDNWLTSIARSNEVGSSAMPHKVNPIDFENAEGNLILANALWEFFSRKLPISRLQRDLSDSTVKRNIGVAFGYSLLGYRALKNGLARVKVDRKTILHDLDAHPEVLAEAIQTILRREGAPMPYEALKNLTRGKKISAIEIKRFVEGLAVPRKVKSRLRRLTPRTYIGLAPKLRKISPRR